MSVPGSSMVALPPAQTIMGEEGRNGYQKNQRHPYHSYREAACQGNSPKNGHGAADPLKEGPGETTGADSFLSTIWFRFLYEVEPPAGREFAFTVKSAPCPL